MDKIVKIEDILIILLKGGGINEDDFKFMYYEYVKSGIIKQEEFKIINIETLHERSRHKKITGDRFGYDDPNGGHGV